MQLLCVSQFGNLGGLQLCLLLGFYRFVPLQWQFNQTSLFVCRCSWLTVCAVNKVEKKLET